MESTVWRRASDVFSQLLDVPETSRSRTLDELELDAEVRACIERLLEAHTRTGLLDSPAPIGGLRAPERKIERRLGCWALDEQIGRGGSGVVFRATTSAGGVERTAAIKVMSFVSLATRGAEHFKREQAILARLNHPHIVPLVDGGVEEDGTPWFAMPLVRGKPIDAWAESAPVRRVLERFVDVCDAVAYAHRALVVHRDLKPSNVWVDETDHVRLLDFGIARLLDEGEESTATHHRMLTPEYAAPEQFRGAPTTTAMDVFGLGALLYRLLTRRAVRARDGDPLAAPVAPSKALARYGDAQRARVVRGDLDAIVLKAVELEPARRYATPIELADDIRRWLAGAAVRARVPSLAYVASRFVARHWLATAATVLALAGIAAGAISSRLEAQRAQHEAARAVAARGLLVDLFGAADPELRDKPVTDVRELLAQWPDRLAQSLADEPDLHAELLLIAGGARARLGDNDEARKLVDEAMRLAQGAGDSELLLGRAHRELAGMDSSVEHWDDARSHLDAAIATFERRSDETTRQLLYMTLLDRAYAVRELRGFDEAGADIARAARMLPSFGPHDSLLEARLYYVRGMQSISLQDNEAARRDFLAARAIVGDDSPRSIPVLTELGQATLWLGRGEEALGYYRQALALAQKVFAPESMRVAEAQHNLGFVLSQLASGDDGEAALREALRIEALNHSTLPNTQSLLARVLRRKGNVVEAVALYDASYEGTLAELGPGHPRTVDFLMRAAQGHLSIDDGAGAWERAQKGVAFAEAIHAQGKEPRVLAAALRDAAWIALKLDRPRDALDLIERTRTLSAPDEDFQIEGCEIRARIALGQAEAAVAVARRIRDDVLAIPRDFAVNRAMAVMALARAEHAVGNDGEARRLLDDARTRPAGVEKYGSWLEREMATLAAELDHASPATAAASTR